MKTKMNLIRHPSLKVLTLCGLLFAATAASACEKAGYTVWSGSGTLGSSKKELKAMGDTLLFLGGAGRRDESAFSKAGRGILKFISKTNSSDADRSGSG